jgi:formate dehydrogenase iron-sulfur subunit
MRFSEVEQNDKLEWLIRKDGCMHCADPGCLKACPAEGAIIQYANGIVDFSPSSASAVATASQAARSTCRA